MLRYNPGERGVLTQLSTPNTCDETTSQAQSEQSAGAAHIEGCACVPPSTAWFDTVAAVGRGESDQPQLSILVPLKTTDNSTVTHAPHAVRLLLHTSLKGL